MNQCSSKLNNHRPLMILLTSMVAAMFLGFVNHSAAFAQTPLPNDLVDRVEVAVPVSTRVLVKTPVRLTAVLLTPVTKIPVTKIPITATLVTKVPTLFEIFAGSVTDQNGKPIAAQVTINGQQVKVGEQGIFRARVPRTKDSRYVINAESLGYVSISQIYVGTGIVDLNLQLQQAQRFEINAQEKIDVKDSRGTQIVIEPGSLVDANGRQAEGPLTLLMYTYDLTREEMVGDMSGIDREGQLVSLESAGAFFAEFRDATGNRYNLAPDAFAEVSIPIEQGIDEKRLAESLILWSYDQERGLWIAEELTVQRNGRHVGRVSHFSTWNFDWKYQDSSCIRLTVDPVYLAANSPIYVQAILQTSPVRIRNLTITDVNNALYNLAPNTDVHFFTPPPYVPPPFAIINSGAPWGGAGVPPLPYDDCNGDIHLGGIGTIEGTKFNDLNGNGVQDPGEPGIPGWTIEIYDSSGNLLVTILTDANGDYSTDVTLPLTSTTGTYTVSEVLPSDWNQTFPASGSHVVTVTSGTTVADIDFGNQYKYKPCRPLDIVFVIDDTGSMSGALTNVKNGLSNIVTTAIGVSGGNYKMGLVSFKDNITVRDDLTASNAASVLANISSLTHSGGANIPEASDESLNTVINNLAAAGRPQNIDFNGTWRPGARKLIVLVTDATPGGFDDTYTIGVDDVNAGLRATEAAAHTAGPIEIAAIFVPTPWSDPNAVPIMQNYATTTGGIYTQTASNGSGVAAAIIEAIQACPDMAIEKSANPDPFQVGQPASYILTVTNVGTGPTVGMPSVVDVLPTGIVPTSVTVAPSTPTGWNCTITTQTVQCDAQSTIAPGESYTITIAVDVTNAAADVVENCARVHDTRFIPGTITVVPSGNNVSCIKTEVQRQPDMAIEKLADPDPFQVGQPGYYILAVTNVGTGTATSPTWVFDTLPNGVIPITVTVSPTPNNWTCNIFPPNVQCQNPGPIAPGESYTITIEVEVTEDALDSVDNCARVKQQDDDNYDNNESCITTEVLGDPDMTIEKIAKPDPFQVGEPGYYILTVTNVGTGTTTSPTWVFDTLPNGVIPITVTVSPTPNNWTCNIFSPNVQCQNPGPIAPGESYTITIEVEVTEDALDFVENCARVKQQDDDNYDNNESCIVTDVLPAVKIHGQKWFDENGNGVQDPGENGLAGWTILLQDSAGNVISTTTDASGYYSFTSLITGTYTVLEVIQPGWTQTNPLGGGQDVTLDGSVMGDIDFGNWDDGNESCAALWDVTLSNDGNTVVIDMTITNLSGSNATYSMNIVGYPGFTINGYTTSPVQPIPVPSGWMTLVEVSMSPLPTITGSSGLYEIILTNDVTGHSFSCTGQLWQSDILNIGPSNNRSSIDIQPQRAEEIVFEVENLTTEDQTVDLEIVEMFGTPGEEIKAISINGQEPGVPVQSQVVVPAGQTIEVGVDIELAQDVPNGVGDVILFADIDGDGNPDVATSVLIYQNGSAADIYVTPEDGTVVATGLYTVNIQVDDIQNFYGNQLEITYDPAIVEVVDADDSSPGVQILHGDFLAPESVIKNTADNGTGVILYSTSLQGNQPGVDGSGVLAQIVFRGLAVGTSPVSLNNVILSDPQSVAISVSKKDGQIVVTELSYDIGGQVLLERRGDDNNSGTEVCVDTQCVTTGDDGSYTLSNVPASGTVQVSRQSYLSSAYDYAATSGGLTNLPAVTLLGGDINQDDVINIDDAVLVGLAWSSTPADPHWDVRADVTDDGKVDILDMVAVQFNWSETAPGPWTGLRAASRRASRSMARAANVASINATDAEAAVAFAPEVSVIKKMNDSTKVDIMVENVTGLYGFTVESSFDPDKVQVIDANPTIAGIQIQVGELLDPANHFVVVNKVDNAEGTLELSVTQTYPATAKNGSGVLGTVTFEAVGTDETAVELTSSTRLVDSSTPEPQAIAAVMENGLLQLPFGGMEIFLPRILR